MRRCLLLFVVLCVSLSVGAVDIQDTFFGYKIGSTVNLTLMQSKMELKQDVSSSIERVSNSKLLNMYKVMFGGIRWDACQVTMLNKGRKFYSIDFSSHFEDEDEAYDLYDVLESMLSGKYGKPVVLDGCLSWGGDNRIGLLLEVKYGRSKGGRMYWYVNMRYFDMDNVVEATSYMDEL